MHMRRRWNRMLSMLLSAGLLLSMVIAPAPVWASDGGGAGGEEKLILEHSFEGSTQGWSGRGGSTTDVSVSEDVARTGTSSLKSSGSNANWHGASLNVLNVLEQGGKYAISVHVRLANAGDEPGSLKLTMHSVGTGGDMYDQLVVSNAVTASDWTELKAEYTVPKDITSLSLIVESANEEVKTPDHYIDDVKIIELAPPSDAFTPIVIAHYGFETDQDGWGPQGPVTVTRSTYEPYAGSYSLLAENRTADWNGLGRELKGVLQPNTTYEISAFVRIANPTTEDSTVKLTMNSGDEYTNVAEADSPANQWTELTGTYRYSGEKTTLFLYVESSKAEDLIYLDEVTIRQITAPDDGGPVLPKFVYDFEPGNQGWHARGDATVERTTEVAYEGDYSLKVTDRKDTWQGAQIDVRTVLQRTAEYKISAYVRPVTAPPDPVTMKLSMQRVFEGESTGWDTVAEQTVSDTEWTLLEGIYSYDKPSSELTLYAEASAASVDFYIDYIVIEMTRAPSPDVTGVSYDFEDGQIGDWFGRFNEEILTVTDADAYSGSYSLLVEAGSANRAAMLDVTDALVPGVPYQVTVWVKLAPGQENTAISLSVEQQSNGESTFQWIDGNKIVTSDSWVRFTGNYAMTSGVDTVRIYIETQESPGVFYIDDFSLAYVQPKDIQRDIPSLKDVFEDYFEIGAAIESKHLAGLHGEMLRKHYNVIVAENVMKPASIQPSEGNYNWAQADAMFEYAEANGMKMRFHTLVWHSQAAEWMFLDESGKDMVLETDPAKREANKALLMQRMKEHITAVVERYKDRVDSWDVVNEVIADGGGMRMADSKWWQIFESDIFIREAFKLVHELDPNAKLFINDYNTHINAKRDTLYEKVREWLDDGVPIHGVGHQTHINYLSPSVDSIVESIRMFGELGLDNQLTELDISIYADDIEAYQEFADIPKDRLIDLAYRYKELFDGLKALEDEEGDYISQVVFWGIGDDHTWLHNRGTTRLNAPFVFDHELQAKDAYWAIVDPSKLPVLAQNLTTYYGTPTIDGNRDSIWDLVSWTEAGEGASFKVLWDDASLYVLTEFDDVTASYLDKVDIYIGNAKYSLKRDGSAVSGAKYKVKELVDRYRVEAQLPLTDAAQGQTIGYDIRFTDSSQSAPISWNDRTHSQDIHQDNFGILTLQHMPKVYTALKGTPDIDAMQEDVWDRADSITTDVWVIGTDGATAQVRALWDDAHLYVLADVEDALLSDVSSQAHEQDSIEIFVDQNHARTPTYQSDDGQYRVNFNNVRTYNGRASADNFRTAAVITPNGYMIEAAIALDPGVAKNGEVIGFDIQVNDDADGNGTRDSVAIWHDPTGNSYQNTSNFGILVMVDPDAEPIIEEEVNRPITDYPPTDDDGDRGGSGGSPIFNLPSAPRFDVRNGAVDITVDRHDAGKPIEVSNRVIRDALDHMVGGVLRIQVNLPSGAEQAAIIQVPMAAIMADGSKVDQLDITIGGATVSISTSEEDGILNRDSQMLTITVREVDRNTLPDEIRDRLDGFPVYEFELRVDGVVIDHFSGRQSVTVRMVYEIQPGQKPHQIVVYYIEDNGKLTVVRNARYDEKTGEIRFNPSHFSRYGASIAAIEFTDMDQAAWAITFVEALASREVVQGVGEGRFLPQRSVTRAEFTQMLMYGLDLVETGTASSFTDVERGAWYADAVASAEQLRIINGKGDGTFGLHEPITREDMAVIAYRALMAIEVSEGLLKEGLSFEDQTQISAYAREAIAEMHSTGLITGYPDGSFRPKESTSRAEAAAVIYRILGLE